MNGSTAGGQKNIPTALNFQTADKIFFNKIFSYQTYMHKKEKKTIIVVTHDDYVAHGAQRIARLKDGKIVKRGGVI